VQSEVSQFRQEQQLQEQAAYQGLNGYATVASHPMIEAHMQQGAERLLQMLEEGKYYEVAVLMETTSWVLEGGNFCETPAP
jgi:hypothetical protein